MPYFNASTEWEPSDAMSLAMLLPGDPDAPVPTLAASTAVTALLLAVAARSRPGEG